jgi:MFS family permease
MIHPPSAPKLADRLRKPYTGLPAAFWVLWCCTLITRLGDFVVPFMTFYLTGVQHIPIAQVGLVLSLYGLGSFGAGPLGGYLTDRLGRRRTMIGAMVISAMTMVALGLSHGLWAMAGLILLLGLFSQAHRPAVSATIADVVPSADRVRAFGLHYWVVNVAFAFASVVGGWVASRTFTALFVADAATTLVAAFLIWRMVPETRPAHVETAERPAEALVSAYQDRLFLSFVVLMLLSGMVVMQFNGTVLLDMQAHGISTATFGQLAALNGVMIVILQPMIGPVMERVSRPAAQSVSALLIGLGIAMTGVVSGVAGYAASIAVWTLGEIAGSGITSAVVADFAPITHRGRYQGVMQTAWGAANCLGPIVGTQVLAHFGAATLWSGCLAIAFVTAAGHVIMAAPMRARFQPAPGLATE